MSGATTPSRDGRVDDPTDGRGLSRYDLVLAVIPAAFLAGILVSAVAGLPPRLGLVGAGVVGALALADGLFLNPPRRSTGRDRGT